MLNYRLLLKIKIQNFPAEQTKIKYGVRLPVFYSNAIKDTRREEEKANAVRRSNNNNKKVKSV